LGQYTIDTPQRSNMSIINIHKSDEISPIIHHTNLMFVHPGKKSVHLCLPIIVVGTCKLFGTKLWTRVPGQVIVSVSISSQCQGTGGWFTVRDPGIPWPIPIPSDFAREPVVAAMVRIVRGRRHGQRGDQRPQLRWSWAKKLRCHGTMSQEKETKLNGSEFHHSNIFQKFLVFLLHAETNC